eukprot:TRINITY_DN922_c0_g2_i1.p1 TRINITY_DN922_c0_g2~~TRINITY_DN922_c0_g2_i1.p1  ORF type:complete len:453 (+),score=55.39 TRINITY_DN922_c0_g2_i1:34-1359(+)
MPLKFTLPPDVEQELALVDATEEEQAAASADLPAAPRRGACRRLLSARPRLALALGLVLTLALAIVTTRRSGDAENSGSLLGSFLRLNAAKYEFLMASAFEKYPGYAGTEHPTGMVTIHKADTTSQLFGWILHSTDDRCTSSVERKKQKCGIMITQGTSCSEATGNPFYVGTENPYTDIQYDSQSLYAMGQQKDVNTGYTGSQLNGKTLIITDADGKRAACSLIKASPVQNPSCFPREASVNVQGRGDVPLASISAGAKVLVQDSFGDLVYEPVVGFLHTTDEAGSFLNVEHSGGRLRASANHLVFVADGSSTTSKLASELRVGDQVFTANEVSKRPVVSVVLGIQVAKSSAGMVAPLTMSGSIVVDRTVASIYATYSSSASIPHSALHALFFPARFLAGISFGKLGAGPSHVDPSVAVMHPLAKLYSQVLTPFAKTILSV